MFEDGFEDAMCDLAFENEAPEPYEDDREEFELRCLDADRAAEADFDEDMAAGENDLDREMELNAEIEAERAYERRAEMAEGFGEF